MTGRSKIDHRAHNICVPFERCLPFRLFFSPSSSSFSTEYTQCSQATLLIKTRWVTERSALHTQEKREKKKKKEAKCLPSLEVIFTHLTDESAPMSDKFHRVSFIVSWWLGVTQLHHQLLPFEWECVHINWKYQPLGTFDCAWTQVTFAVSTDIQQTIHWMRKGRVKRCKGSRESLGIQVDQLFYWLHYWSYS